MGLSSVELWQRIAASQLASPLLCRTWAADAASVLSASEAIEGARVGEQLVKQGKLTQFQIECLLGDNKLPLIRHGYRILEPVDYTPYPAPDVRSIWHQWWAVAKTPTSPTLWMRWLQADEFKLPALAQSNPALPRALQHSQVRQDRLQTVQPPEMASGTLQLCVEPLQGQLLSGSCDGQAQPLPRVLALLTEVASALAPLHAAGLAHGRVTPDRICVNADGRHQLLRDPLCSATLQLKAGKSATVSGLLMPQLPGKLDAAHFMAPEFLLPAQVATPQSDIYSLGCVAWLLLTGNVPYTAKQPEQVLAAHAEHSLDIDMLGTIPEPISRCLWHCLAKNPGARFAQAAQLINALREAQSIAARGRTVPPKSAAKSTEPVRATAVESKSEPKLALNPAAASTPIETKPVVAAAPALAKAVESKPVESKPVESKPVESKPVESKPKAEVATSKPSRPVVQSRPAASAGNKPASTLDPDSVKSAFESPVAVPSNVETIPAAPGTLAAVLATTPESTSTTSAETGSTVTQESSTASSLAVAQSAPAAAAAATTPAATAAPQAAKPQKRLAAPGKPPSRRSPVRKTKKRKGTNWLTPVIGGGALLVLLLVILVLSGGLGSRDSSSNNANSNNASSNNSSNPQNTSKQPTIEPVKVDPLAEKYELVTDAPSTLWAPPRVAEPLPLNLLPPGGQFFAGLRPAKLFAQSEAKQLISLLDSDLSPLWKSITDTCGVPLEQIDQVVLVAYPNENGAPQTALRVKLIEGQLLSQLKVKWQSPTDTKVKEHALLVSGPRAFYVQQQPLVDSQSVTEFSVGPTELMREAAELQGAETAMTGQMEQLHQATDQIADINLLVNPVFFYTEGRAWLDHSPPRFRAELEKWATRELRGLMLSTSLSEPWYYELRLVGATDRDSVVNMQKLSDAKHQLPQVIESWLVNELPHPHWRAMANRFPNMLRALDTQSRVGAENGQAIVNGYLPIAAASNLIYASWMAVQTGSTGSSGSVAANAVGNTSTATAALTPEQILDRKITLKMDQTGIENVLQAIGEEANKELPPGTKVLPFELDGAGFQRSGITRNQQIKPSFEVVGQTVRQSLILLSKKGNPVQPLDDIKSDDQKLIWVLIDGDKPEKAKLSLTSREAANAAGYKLPVEYTK